MDENTTKAILQVDNLFKDYLKEEPDINKVIDRLVDETGQERAFLEESAISGGFLREKFLEGYKFVRLRDIDASMIGEKVEIEVDVLSHQLQRAFPTKFETQCLRCEIVVKFGLEDMAKDPKYPDMEELVVGKWERSSEQAGDMLLLNANCNHDGSRKASVCRVTERGDFAVLSVKDRIDEIDQWNQGTETAFWVYVMNQTVGYDYRVSITGTITAQRRHGKIGDELVIFANGVQPLPFEYATYEVTEDDRQTFSKYFGPGKDITSQISPDMVGKDLVREARLLTLHSMSELPDITGQPIRGAIHEINLGDTRTYKSRGMRDIYETFKLGEPFSAETGRRTGLTYSIDPENRTVNMGVMPRNDRGLVLVDGMQRFHEEEMGQFREVLSEERIRVRAVAVADAWARNRLVGALNPRSQMNNYIFRCQAIPDCRIFKNAPDIPRWDLWLIYGDDDVSKIDIANREPLERPIPIDVFRRHVYWAWSRRSKDVSYSVNAKEKIKQESVRIMEKYSSQTLPVVSNEFRETLTRVTVACACMRHSTDLTNTKVLVKAEHVEETVNFLERMYDDMELLEFKSNEEGTTQLDDKEIAEILTLAKEKHLAIMQLLIEGAKSSSVLAERLQISVPTVIRRYILLKEKGLIKTSSQGAGLTTKGIQFAKYLLTNSDIILSKTDSAQTNFKSDLEEALSTTDSVIVPIPKGELSQKDIVDVISEILLSSEYGNDQEQLSAMRKEGIENPEKWMHHLANQKPPLVNQAREGTPWKVAR